MADMVGPSDDAEAAIRLLLASGLPGLAVYVDRSFVVVPASEVFRAALPRYVLDDPALGRVWDEASADRSFARLAGRRVADLLADLDTDDDAPRHVVDGSATTVEIAAVMAAAHVPMVVVVERGALLGVITVTDLITRLLP